MNHPAVVPLEEALRSRYDVVVVGAGHNGLVAALSAARAGLSVLVLEEKDVVGGAARTERPFAKAPNLRHLDRRLPARA